MIPAARSSGVVYGLAAVDCRGRVADRVVMTALRWKPGMRLDIHEARGLLVVQAALGGVFAVTKQGHLRLPASVRHCCGLVPGDRVLLVADPGQEVAGRAPAGRVGRAARSPARRTRWR
ncbi:hypothetical protein GCM10022247_05290 [Allokutzneria multivorans]|uniref:AbrB/MazE/SpoVT family DNA-binding domain-containing protein n=1 Tax=Allokutzneria multivorans TaxID=1142134 RepID=A0ABP7QXR4_9PSEU